MEIFSHKFEKYCSLKKKFKKTDPISPEGYISLNPPKETHEHNLVFHENIYLNDLADNIALQGEQKALQANRIDIFSGNFGVSYLEHLESLLTLPLSHLSREYASKLNLLLLNTGRNDAAESSLGKYREQYIKTGLYKVIYPMAVEVEALMERFFEWNRQCNEKLGKWKKVAAFEKNYSFPKYEANKTIEFSSENFEQGEILWPIMFAGTALHNINRIHPFTDGNGRFARLIMNSILLYSGFPAIYFEGNLANIYAFALQKYDQALWHPSDPEPINFFYGFLSDVLLKTLEISNEAMERHIRSIKKF